MKRCGFTGWCLQGAHPSLLQKAKAKATLETQGRTQDVAQSVGWREQELAKEAVSVSAKICLFLRQRRLRKWREENSLEFHKYGLLCVRQCI